MTQVFADKMSESAGNTAVNPDTEAATMAPVAETTEASSTETPAATETTEMEVTSTEETGVVTVLSELDKYWSTVRDNPGDFTGWTYLLQYVEQEGELENARPAFEEFLAKYPYCYGYWKKYADLERKKGNIEQCEQVFEKGIGGIPLSIDLWIHYINFGQESYEANTEKEGKIRQLYERAVAAAGMDFRSDKLWEMYINWEQTTGNLKGVTALYDRVLATPTQLYTQHYDNLSKHVEQNHPKDILSTEDFLKVRLEVSKVRSPKPDAAKEGSPAPPPPPPAEPPTEAAAPPPPEPAPSEAEPAPSEAASTETPAAPDAEAAKEEKKTDEEKPAAKSETAPEAETEIDEAEMKLIREHIKATRHAVHKLNEQEVSQRWTFEEGIRRPYFHVKPLEKTQINNWRDYLDYEIEYGAHERVIVLFERCLIACALYEEFWMKYARYLQDHSPESVRGVFQRACLIFLRKKPNIHLAWSTFEEKQNDYEASQKALTTLQEEVPGLTSVALRQVSLARRQGHFDKVEALYKRFIEEAVNDKERSFYATKYARYQAKVLRNISGACETLENALAKDEANEKLFLQLLDIEYQRPDMDETRILSIFDRVMKSSLTEDQKALFLQRKTEFMEDFGSNVAKVQEAFEEQQKFLKDINSLAAKKRKASEAVDDTQTDKKAKTDNGHVANGTVDYSQQNVDYSQWGYGTQQWNQSYNTTPYQYNPWAAYSSTYY